MLPLEVGYSYKMKQLGDYNDPQSLGSRLRQRRFKIFLSEFPEFSEKTKLSILDLGGTPQFWQFIPQSQNHTITLLNLEQIPVLSPNFISIAGDACNLERFDSQSFDIVFSNSVIEHVGDLQRQSRMASEIQRVGKRFWVQTPNFYFPIEPHFICPFFHWLPVNIRAKILLMVGLGHYGKQSDYESALRAVNSISLLTKTQFKHLFSGHRVISERLLLEKSFIAIK
jgi:hypothetical protein